MSWWYAADIVVAVCFVVLAQELSSLSVMEHNVARLEGKVDEGNARVRDLEGLIASIDAVTDLTARAAASADQVRVHTCCVDCVAACISVRVSVNVRDWGCVCWCGCVCMCGCVCVYVCVCGYVGVGVDVDVDVDVCMCMCMCV